MAKRISSFLMALLVGWFSITQPVRAFAPPVVPLALAPAAVTPAGAVALGTAVLVGMVVSSILVKDANTDYQVRIPTNTLPSSQPSPPAAPATANPVGGVPAGDLDMSAYWCSDNAPLSYSWACGQQTSMSACLSWASLPTGGAHKICRTVTSAGAPTGTGYSYNMTGATNPSWLQSGPADANPVCPSGYSVSGSSCSLVDARQALADSNVDVYRNGQSVAYASLNDADLSASTIKGSFGADGGYIEIAGVDSQGRPTQLVVRPAADGGSIITQATGYSAGTSAGTINQVAYQVGSDGTVTSIQSATVQGQLQVNPTTGTASITGNPTVQNPDGTVSTQPATQKVDVQFPSDYARDVTVASVRTEIGNLKTETTAIKDRLTNSEDLADPSIPESSQFHDAFFPETFSGLLSWQLPAHSSVCPQPSFAWDGSTYVFSSHCGLINDHWGLLQSAMAIVWTIAALYVVLRS